MRSLFKRNLLEIKIKVAGDGDPQGQRRTIFQDQSKAQAKWGEGEENGERPRWWPALSFPLTLNPRTEIISSLKPGTLKLPESYLRSPSWESTRWLQDPLPWPF